MTLENATPGDCPHHSCIVDISRKALERQFVDEVLAAVAARFKHEAVDELLEEFRSKMNVVSGDTP